MASSGKNFIFYAALLLAAFIFCEAVSAAGLAAAYGRTILYADLSLLQKERRLIAPAEKPGLNMDKEVLHPYQGFVFNEHRRETYYGFPVTEYGFMDDKAPVQKRGPGKVLLGIMGGSFGLDFSVQAADVLVSELKKFPAFQDKEIVPVRMALGGYKQPQQLTAFSYLLSLGAEFDILVNIDGFNEIALPFHENLRQGINPFFPRNWIVLSQRDYNQEHARRIFFADVLRRLRHRGADIFSHSLAARSLTLNMIWKVWDRVLEKALYKVQIVEPGETGPLPFETRGPSYRAPEGAELFEDLGEMWRKSSFLMHQISLANGIRYFHFLQPNQYVPDSKPMGEEERKTALHPDAPFRTPVELGYPVLVRKGLELKKDGVAFTDLTGAFKETEEPVYGDDCCHLVEDGYRLLAEKIAAVIAGENAAGKND